MYVHNINMYVLLCLCPKQGLIYLTVLRSLSVGQRMLEYPIYLAAGVMGLIVICLLRRSYTIHHTPILS